MGVGVSRCGTTWFTEMLTQHPRVDLPNGVKELQFLHKEPADLDEYCKLFTDGDLTGEFTPRYLRVVTAIARVQAVLPDDAPIIVLLRDPIDRFESAVRQRVQRDKLPLRGVISDHIWAGMYADQLDLWASVVGRERMIVLQFEAIRPDPRPAVEHVWKLLGLEPVPLEDIDRPTRNCSRAEWTWPDGLREHLTGLYTPQMDRLADRYGVNPGLWRNFAGA